MTKDEPDLDDLLKPVSAKTEPLWASWKDAALGTAALNTTPAHRANKSLSMRLVAKYKRPVDKT